MMACNCRLSRRPKPGAFMVLVRLLLLVVFSAINLQAQRNCTKGIPCGNSCISATKTCRIGSTSRPSTSETSKPQSPDPLKKDLTSTDSTSKGKDEVAGERVWVNTKSRVYHCPGTRYFGKTASGKYLTEREASEQGNRPAYGKKCSP